MPGKYMQGALVEFVETFGLPIPNVIIFQFNPETMVHTWTQPEDDYSEGNLMPGTFMRTNPLAVKGTPGESFSFTIAMDANDMIADGSPVAQSIAVTTGIYTRISALEMLQYPVDAGGGGLLGTVSAAANAVGGLFSGGSSEPPSDIPQAEIPIVLFVWGPGRIVPVRVTGLTITEQLFDVLLNPTHAEAQLNLRVLAPEELKAVKGTRGKLAVTAYNYSFKRRQTLALANIANGIESIIGMLPL